MNDHDEPAPEDPGTMEPAFDDPAHAWVRDLLADARETGPAPTEVTARLDETLAALQAERAGTGPRPDEGSPATVVPLRRRLLPRLTAAAAAVIVLVGGGVALTRLDLGGSDSSQSTTSGAADSSSEKTASQSSPGSGTAPEALADAAVPRLSSSSFAADAAAVMRRVASGQMAANGTLDSVSSPAPASGDSPTGPTTEGQTGSIPLQAPAVTATPKSLRAERRPTSATACAGPRVAGAVTLPGVLDGTPVALVFRPPTATSQLVEAWACDGSTLLTEATIPTQP